MGGLFRAMQYGHELRNATGIKWAQALVIALSLAYWTAKSFGFDPGWTDEQLFNVVGLGSSVFGLAATFLTTRRLGVGRRRRPPPHYEDRGDYAPSGIPETYVPGNSGPGFPSNPFLDGDY